MFFEDMIMKNKNETKLYPHLCFLCKIVGAYSRLNLSHRAKGTMSLRVHPLTTGLDNRTGRYYKWNSGKQAKSSSRVYIHTLRHRQYWAGNYACLLVKTFSWSN